MLRIFLSCTALVPLLAGCATSGDPLISVTAAQQAVAGAAAQVRRCYRDPPVPSVAARITTRLRVRYDPDGVLIGIPQIVFQQGITPANQAYAARMAEAASLAVMRCSPLHLPPEAHHGGWDEFDLTFSHAALG
jgi:hypothetical protein